MLLSSLSYLLTSVAFVAAAPTTINAPQDGRQQLERRACPAILRPNFVLNLQQQHPDSSGNKDIIFASNSTTDHPNTLSAVHFTGIPAGTTKCTFEVVLNADSQFANIGNPNLAVYKANRELVPEDNWISTVPFESGNLLTKQQYLGAVGFQTTLPPVTFPCTSGLNVSLIAGVDTQGSVQFNQRADSGVQLRADC